MSQELVVNKCDRCNKIYATKYTLAVHQKTSKSCVVDDSQKKTYECEYCKKKISSTQNLKYHLDICPVKIEEEQKKEKQKKEKEIKILKKQLETVEKETAQQIEILKKQYETKEKNLKHQEKKYQKEIVEKDLTITKLETKLEQLEKQLLDKDKQLEKQLLENSQNNNKQLDTIKDLAKTAIEKKTTTTVKNTTVNNVAGDLTLYFNQDVINQKIHTKLTENDLYTGYKGIAEFLKINIATDDNGKLIYFCVDPARQYFCYKDDQGNEVKDLKAQKMIALIKTAMQERIAAIYEEQCRKQTRLIEEKVDMNGREMKMCVFAIEKTGKLKTDIYGITDHNKMASEMAKILYK